MYHIFFPFIARQLSNKASNFIPAMINDDFSFCGDPYLAGFLGGFLSRLSLVFFSFRVLPAGLVFAALLFCSSSLPATLHSLTFGVAVFHGTLLSLVLICHGFGMTPSSSTPTLQVSRS